MHALRCQCRLSIACHAPHCLAARQPQTARLPPARARVRSWVGQPQLLSCSCSAAGSGMMGIAFVVGVPHCHASS